MSVIAPFRQLFFADARPDGPLIAGGFNRTGSILRIARDGKLHEALYSEGTSTQDFAFPSPIAAASVAFRRTTSGHQARKSIDADWKKAHSAEVAP